MIWLPSSDDLSSTLNQDFIFWNGEIDFKKFFFMFSLWNISKTSMPKNIVKLALSPFFGWILVPKNPISGTWSFTTW